MQAPFETVVAQHSATVLRVCRSLLGAHDADDAWSETFLAAMRAYPSLPDTANVEAWLVTIARRKAIDVLRTAARAPLPIADLPEVPSGLGIPGSGGRELWQAVAGLPEKQRLSVTLRYLAGMSYAEIAETIGGSTDAARRASADALKKLRITYPHAPSKGARS